MHTFTIAQLDQLIEKAAALGFHDDVAHWTAEKNRMLAELEKNR